MTLYTSVEALDGKIYNVPADIPCQMCDKRAKRNSDVEPGLPGSSEDTYIAYYECENGHNTKAFVKHRK